MQTAHAATVTGKRSLFRAEMQGWKEGNAQAARSVGLWSCPYSLQQLTKRQGCSLSAVHVCMHACVHAVQCLYNHAKGPVMAIIRPHTLSAHALIGCT